MDLNEQVVFKFYFFIFFRLEAKILRTFFERRSIVIFLTLNMFLPTGEDT